MVKNALKIAVVMMLIALLLLPGMASARTVVSPPPASEGILLPDPAPDQLCGELLPGDVITDSNGDVYGVYLANGHLAILCNPPPNS